MIPGIPLNITLESSSVFHNTSHLVNESIINVNARFNSDIAPGKYIIQISLALKNTIFQTFEIIIDMKANVRIPSGLIYLLGAGILAGVFILVRRPPEWLQKRLKEWNLDSLDSPSEQNQSTDEVDH
jgi:hypothetical protein